MNVCWCRPRQTSSAFMYITFGNVQCRERSKGAVSESDPPSPTSLSLTPNPPPPPSRTMVVVVTHVIYLGCNPLGPGATNAPHISIKRCGRHQPTNNLLLIGWEIYPVAYTAEDILVKRGGEVGVSVSYITEGSSSFFFFFLHITPLSPANLEHSNTRFGYSYYEYGFPLCS
ncbi:unnamed protein product [Boreogadus saida]